MVIYFYLNIKKLKLSRLLLLLCLLSVTTLSYYIYYLFLNDNINNSACCSKPPIVCIVGNAQTKNHAMKIHQMWEYRFDSFWYIWDDISTEHITRLNNIAFLYSNRNLS